MSRQIWEGDAVQEGFVVWFTGLSGAGKSTLANLLSAELRGRGVRVELLDGDEVRQNLSKGLGFSREDRDANILRIAYVARLLARNGVAVLVAAISPYASTRAEARRQIGRFVEVYVKCSLSGLVRRDPKGLYARALRGEIPNFTGVSDPYEEPAAPEVVVDTELGSPSQAIEQIVAKLEHLGYLAPPDGLIAPYGGRLVDLTVGHQEALELVQELRSAPKVVLSRRSLLDLGLVAVGALSPLTGFMGNEDYSSVLDSMRLASGLPWTIPIILPVDPAQADGLEIGRKVALVDGSGRIVASLVLQEIFERDLRREAFALFGTDDGAHPGVSALMSWSRYLMAGPVSVLTNPWDGVLSDHLTRYILSPKQTRELFRSRGWRTVVGFQTRNPVHRADEYIQKCALEVCDGLLLHPLVGETKGDDLPAELRLRCYRALLEHYYPPDLVVLSLLPANMHYAGPREAVHHALIRRNYGCSHFTVGRDHAGVGSYYGPYDAQAIFGQFSKHEIGVTALFFENAFYCRVCGGMATRKTCPHGEDDGLSLSGSRVRQMLASGIMPPQEFTRPEVARVLVGGLGAQERVAPGVRPDGIDGGG